MYAIRSYYGADAAVQAAVQLVIVADVLLDILEDLFEFVPADRGAVRHRVADMFLDAGGVRVRHGAPVMLAAGTERSPGSSWLSRSYNFV